MNGKYVTSFSKPSHWMSCRFIYSELLPQYQDHSLWLVDQQVVPKDIRELVVIDHRWLPAVKASQLPKDCLVTLYVFGDLTLKLAEFNELKTALSTRLQTVIVASDAQKKLLGNIFPDLLGCTIKKSYPFKLSQVNAEKVAKFKEEIFLKPGQKLLGYVGRMSRQKGVLELMEAFLKNQAYLNAKLLLCGPIDFHPFWQMSEGPDVQGLRRFEAMLKVSTGSIVWIPFIERQLISKVYQSLDLLVSPSTFHDEDYGLSVAEALSQGTRCLISAWGGYLEHQENPLVEYLYPKLSDHGYTVSSSQIEAALLGQKSSAPISWPVASLTEEERSYIFHNPKFLIRDGAFYSELYKKIYASYLLC